jgi:hypothetical protein
LSTAQIGRGPRCWAERVDDPQVVAERPLRPPGLV